MELYQQKYKDRNGIQRTAAKWYLRFRDHTDQRRWWPLHKDKKVSEGLAKKIDALIGLKVNSEPLTADVSAWLENIPEALRLKLAQIGLIDRRRAEAGLLLTEHLENYERCLLREFKSKSVVNVKGRIERILNECEFVMFSDVDPLEIKKFLDALLDRDEISKRTYNGYIQAIKQFCSWAADPLQRLITQSPVEVLAKFKIEKKDIKKKRRPLTPKKFKHLLAITQDQPKRFSLTGPQRAMVYRLAAETGLRANEIRSLTVSSFDLKKPSVRLSGEYTKNDDNAFLPLTPKIAVALVPFLTGKMPHVRAFKLTDKTSKMLQADLEAAEIPFTDDSGRDFDFHAFRHTQGSLLAASGATPAVAMELMRHSDIRLTMNVYTHTLAGDEVKAIEALPDLTPEIEKDETSKIERA
jgi:integrase